MSNNPSTKSTLFNEFVAQAQPISWNSRTEMQLTEWFRWPPDVFALASLVLACSGAYRRAVAPQDEHWPKPGWPRKAQDTAEIWREWVANGAATEDFPPAVAEYKSRLEALSNVEVDDLYDPIAADSWDLCVVLLELLSIADETMRGVGIFFAPRATLELVKEGQHVGENISFFYLQANFLLTLRGSLSRMPKFRGIVLPKARTPQTGLTLRSFSNNLTFHQTEVDVAWRSFPWFNSDENTVNLMIVPWPFEVPGRSFRPIPHPKAQSQLGPDRYFHYEPDAENSLDVTALVDTLRRANKEVRRVHMLVFPEMALRPPELSALKEALEELPPLEIPMIVTGLSAPYKLKGEESNGGRRAEPEPGEGAEHRKDQDHFTPGEHAAGYNRVVLSLYYAGKWHDVLQDKHHRWKLNQAQIEQYSLGGMLSGTRHWWEAIQIFRRRLSVLAANSWLTVCPLICEDLARLDPVSELVRGIGPTLLTALLLDGPQLKSRWSARYASVFADDPGSSVLTLTSFGMSHRSTIPGHVSEEDLENARKGANVIGLWKDRKNWHEIRVTEPKAPVKVVTIGAVWETEKAFDGRVDQESSAVFVFQGMFDERLRRGLTAEDETCSEGSPPGHDRSHDRAPGASGPWWSPEHGEEQQADARAKKLEILYMCELTLLTFYTDALVDADSVDRAQELSSWFSAINRQPGNGAQEPWSALQKEIIGWLSHSIETRDLVPEAVPTPQLRLTVARVTDLVVGALESTADSLLPLTYWTELKRRAKTSMDESCAMMKTQPEQYRERIESIAEKHDAPFAEVENLIEIGRLVLMAPLAVLWAVHSRLSTRRRYGVLEFEGADLIRQIEEIANQSDYHETYRTWRKSLQSAEAPTA